MQNEKEIKSSFDLAIFLRLFSYAKKYWLSLLFTIILMTLVTAIDLTLPYVTKIAVDDFIKPDTYSVTPTDDATLAVMGNASEGYYRLATVPELLLDPDGAIDVTNDGQTPYITDHLNAQRIEQLKVLTIAVAILLILSFIMTFAHTYLLNYASQKIVYGLRDNLFTHLQSMSLAFFDKNPVGRLVTRISNDMNNIKDMFTDVLVTSLKDFFLLGGTVIVMFSINAKLAIVSLFTMPFIIIAASIFRRKARAVQREVKVKLAKINATLAENINGMKIIQIFNKEEDIYNDFKAINDDYLSSSVQETKVYATFRPLMNLAYSVSLALLLWFGGGDVMQNNIELGVLVAFISYAQQFFRPIMDLSEKFNILQSSMASSERVFMLLDETDEIENPKVPQALEKDAVKGDITFDHVWFSYTGEESEYVLRDVSFDVKAGQTVALVGATGSGKTTIISLLNRFYDIQKGEIRIDGIPIKDVQKEKLRESIGIVLQDVFLFAGDIKSNIRLYEEGISDETIEKVTQFVNADRFIDHLPGRFDEPVVERGATLSSGQRQLLSFARALAFDPKILILDEATSNIDTETELLIQDAIQKMITGRTTIIVAHRLSTIQHADKIIVMHKGKIREVGTHQELLDKGGMYYDLYNLQYKE